MRIATYVDIIVLRCVGDSRQEVITSTVRVHIFIRWYSSSLQMERQTFYAGPTGVLGYHSSNFCCRMVSLFTEDRSTFPLGLLIHDSALSRLFAKNV